MIENQFTGIDVPDEQAAAMLQVLARVAILAHYEEEAPVKARLCRRFLDDLLIRAQVLIEQLDKVDARHQSREFGC